ncbi:MAG TPA: hypothetical protein DCY36_07275 [Acidimicrobiaceae bacterium]|nr:hypothetical protein [Acidimicrobiaceae bacterium]HAY65813.1 hypothetical protein [Acidimicrobiaceae bacterium]
MNSVYGSADKSDRVLDQFLAESDVFYITGISWNANQPFFRVQSNSSHTSELFPATATEMRFRVASGEPRICIGRVARTKSGPAFKQCWSPATKAKRCDPCQKIENITAANMHQAHRMRRHQVDSEMVKYLSCPHRLYLAIFRDGSSKVGTTRGNTSDNRLLEQGAWLANYIALVDDGFAVRELEDLISRELGVSQAVDTRKKYGGHLRPLPDRELTERLDLLLEACENLMKHETSASLSLLKERWSNPHSGSGLWSGLSAYPASLTQGSHAFTIRSMVGRLAACTREGFKETFLIDTQQLLALPLQTGEFEISEISMQESLF